MNSLKRKNIESFLVDFFIIVGLYFIKSIEISEISFMVLIITTTIIILIEKKPPKNVLLAFFYTTSIFFILFGIIYMFGLFGDSLKSEMTNLSLMSIFVLILNLLAYIMFLLSIVFPKKPIGLILETYVIPVLFTLIILSITGFVRKYSTGGVIVILVYLPIRFLMAYKTPVKWYQFILIFATLFIAFRPFYIDDEDYPAKPLKGRFHIVDVKMRYELYGSYENDSIIKCVLTKGLNAPGKIHEGTYYLIVSNIWNNTWRFDRQKTLEYYEKNLSYQMRNISRLVQTYGPSEYGWEMRDKLQKAKYYCDTAQIYISQNKLAKAEQRLIKAQKFYPEYGRIYFLKATINDKKGDTDSICILIDKALQLKNPDALQLFREYCLNWQKNENMMSDNLTQKKAD